MTNRIGSDDEPLRTGYAGESVPGDESDEDLATMLTRGVADGFAEASHAFSTELAGSNHIPELMGRSVAGVIRANARLLDEVATVVRHAADSYGSQHRIVDVENVDYERLATMVAERLRADETPAATAKKMGTA